MAKYQGVHVAEAGIVVMAPKDWSNDKLDRIQTEVIEVLKLLHDEAEVLIRAIDPELTYWPRY